MNNDENVLVIKEGDTATIKITGSFDAATTPAISNQCQRMAGDKAIRKIVLDFKEVSRIDTSAFACAIGFMAEHLKKGIEVYFMNLADAHKKYISLLKLSKAFKIT